MVQNSGIQNQSSQIPANTDLLSPNRFQVVIAKYPNVTYFAQRVPIPSVNLGTTHQFTNQEVDIKLPGDKIEYDDLLISFIIDEDVASFAEILRWIQDAAGSELSPQDLMTDLSIVILTNNSNKNKTFKFYNAFPYSISNIMLDVTVSEDQPLTADVMFKYTHFTIV